MIFLPVQVLSARVSDKLDVIMYYLPDVRQHRITATVIFLLYAESIVAYTYCRED